jgi:serine/threonine-protein kinase
MPTRADVDLARAAIDRGLLTIKESVRCLEIQREFEQKGKQVPLEKIFVKTRLINEAQLDQLKKSLARTQALRHIGQYELLAKVGTGGMGTVYKAKDTKADRIVALKVLSSGLAGNKDYVRRFLREALASGRLSHPNIVQGIDAGEADRHYYFAMEFIEGTTVAEMLKDGQPIPEQQALDIAIQIAKALRHAEENNLIHRDIKPDNIMITEDGTAKLADLGLARLAVGAAQEQGAFGTAYYASPEQCEGAEELDSKTDMYAFGATLFHMIAGHVPFDAETPEEILMMHLKERRPYLKDENVQLTHGVSKIVRKLMSINKRDRYVSFDAVVKDLTLVRMGRSPRLGKQPQFESGEYRYRSETGTWRTKPPKRMRKSLKIAIAAAVAGLILAVGGYIYYRLTRPAVVVLPGGPTTPLGRVTTPAAAGRTEAEIYLERILVKLDELPFERRIEKLRSVSERYPETPQAKEATARLEAMLANQKAEAQPLFLAIETEVEALRAQDRFRVALDKLGEFPEGYERTEFPGRIETLRASLRKQADKRFKELATQSNARRKNKEFEKARAPYERVVNRFGIAKYVTKARQRIQSIDRAEAAHKKKLAEEKRKRERAARLEQDRKTVASVLARVPALLGKRKIGDAVAALTDAVKSIRLLETEKQQLARARRDLAAAKALVDALKEGRTALKGKTVRLQPDEGDELEGEIFSVSDQRLSVQTTGKAIRSIGWGELPPGELVKLVALHKGDKLEPADRYALSTLLLLFGDAKAARAQLDAVTETEDTKKPLQSRRAAFELFAPKAGNDAEAKPDNDAGPKPDKKAAPKPDNDAEARPDSDAEPRRLS